MRPFLILLLLISTCLAEFRVKSSGPHSLVLKWNSVSASDVTVRAPVSIPPGSRVELNTRILTSRQTASGAPAGMARAFQARVIEGGRFRDVQVAILEFSPRYFSAGKERMLISAEFTLTFTAGSATESSGYRPSFAGAITSPAEKYLENWLVNYNQSRGYRSVTSGLAKRSPPSLPIPQERLVIKTLEESIVRINVSGLERAGVPVSDVDPRYIRVYKGAKEIPIYIEGASDGRLDATDFIEFIGARPRGSEIAGGITAYNSFYTDRAVFYLVWGGNVPGLRAPLVPVAGEVGGVLGDPENAAPLAQSFKVKIHIEHDNEIRRIGGVSIEDIQDLGSSVEDIEMTDFWFWQRQGADVELVDIPFEIPFSSADPDDLEGEDSLIVRVKLQGITDNFKAEFDHHIKFILNSKDISDVGGVQNNAKWSGDNDFLWESNLLTASILQKGENTLTLQKIKDLFTSDGNEVTNRDAYLDYIELEFRAGFNVVKDRIRFNNDYNTAPSARRYLLQGLSKSDYSLWDLSGRKLSGFNLIQGQQGGQISFTDSSMSQTEFILTNVDDIATAEIALDTLEDLLGADIQADYIVITQKKLMGPDLDLLLSQRESQGLTTKVVRADHIYQTFGDGATDPRSIREFLKYAYRSWRRPAPTYVLLLGETSLWFDKKTGGFQQNIVPTNLIQIPGWGVTSNDDFFTKISGDDQIEDLFIGRIPVATQADFHNHVTKMLAYENERENGNWQNRIFLISGFEKSFALTNNRLQNRITGASRQFTRLDVWDTSGYYRPADEEPGFYTQFDSAFNIVSFTGHGGGSVWSDRALLTLEALDQDSIKGEYSVPLITSMTCLTGFFEDVDQRSLGEELLRRETSGALAFYGASGYTSEVAGELISEQIFNAALSPGRHTVGEIIAQGENLVAFTTGSFLIPILGEFDLLGDPAMPLVFPDVNDKMNLTGSPKKDSPDLSAEAEDLAVETGEGVISVYALYNDSSEADSTFFNRNLDVSGSSFSESFEFTETNNGFPVLNSGKVIAHYWDDSESRVTRSDFNSLDWMIDSLTLSSDDPMLGSNVSLGFKVVKLPGVIKQVFGRITYEVVQKTDPLVNPEISRGGVEIPVLKSGNIITSRNPFTLSTNLESIIEPEFRVVIDLNLILDDDGDEIAMPLLRSRVYRIPLMAPADLQFTRPALTLPIQNTLGVYAHIKNAGLGADTGFSVVLTTLEEDGSVFRTDTVTFSDPLGPNQVDSIFIPLQTTSQLTKRFRLVLIASDKSREVNIAGNQADTTMSVLTNMIARSTDSLYSHDSSLCVTFAAGPPVRVFLEKVTDALAVPSHLTPVVSNAGVPEYYRIQAAEDFTGSLVMIQKNTTAGPLSLNRIRAGTPAPDRPLRSAGPRLHYYLSDINNWLKLDTLQDSTSHARWFKSGIYGVFSNADQQTPDLNFSSKGQKLLRDDFVPQRSNINITLRDNVAIDYYLHPPEITSEQMVFDSTNLVNKATGGLGKTGVLQFLPQGSVERDSISVTVRDISGNLSQENFVYKKGNGLSVKLFGTYPNPFADSAVIVYQLTDWADEVKLKIYSRAGRLVKSFKDDPGTGYREIVWDGRSKTGNEVANGLYYLKVTARQSDNNSSAIFKIFKMKRK